MLHLAIIKKNSMWPLQNALDFSKYITISRSIGIDAWAESAKRIVYIKLGSTTWQLINISSIFEVINRKNKDHIPINFNEINLNFIQLFETWSLLFLFMTSVILDILMYCHVFEPNLMYTIRFACSTLASMLPVRCNC